MEWLPYGRVPGRPQTLSLSPLAPKLDLPNLKQPKPSRLARIPLLSSSAPQLSQLARKSRRKLEQWIIITDIAGYELLNLILLLLRVRNIHFFKTNYDENRADIIVLIYIHASVDKLVTFVAPGGDNEFEVKYFCPSRN